ncbi:MAG: FumA C-terminus/TtdB family hydratase beta subunit [Pseudomonadota bacterium]
MVAPSEAAALDQTLPFTPTFQLGDEGMRYRLVSREGVEEITLGGRTFLSVSPAALTRLAQEAFDDVSHYFRRSHLQALSDILSDPDASGNDRLVARELLKNAVIAGEGAFPSCQDTGTAIISAKKGQDVLVDGDVQAALSEGVALTYQTRNLRFSQMAPVSTFQEVNTGNNLPAQIDVEAVGGNKFEGIFIAKGGGSANKTYLFQETRRVLEPERLLVFFDEKIRTIGTAACPPYYLAIVVGGLSAEQTLKTVKLASTRALDTLPTTGDATGRAFRDVAMEQEIHKLTQSFGVGAQFGGKYFCHGVRFIRLPRHGGSLPIGLGVSCSADRQIKGRIDREGIWVEALEREPADFLPSVELSSDKAVSIDIDRPMDEVRSELSRLSVGTPVVMSGTVIVARDLVHAELHKRLERDGELPEYFVRHPIYYAGPAKTPEGFSSGSFGPTTAARMDPYVPGFMAAGGNLVTIAKGNRSAGVKKACADHGGFYLAAIGGTAAVFGRDVVDELEPIDYAHFGMEAVWRVRVKNFPAFVVIDDKGNDFYARLTPG